MIPYVFGAFAVLLVLAAYNQPVAISRVARRADDAPQCSPPRDETAASTKDSLEDILQNTSNNVKKCPSSCGKIADEVKQEYNEVIDSLKKDIEGSEKDSRLLQAQIDWISRRRAELKDEVLCGQNMYRQAVSGLAKGLRDIQNSARPVPSLNGSARYSMSANVSMMEKCKRFDDVQKPVSEKVCPMVNAKPCAKKSSGSIRLEKVKSKASLKCNNTQS